MRSTTSGTRRGIHPLSDATNTLPGISPVIIHQAIGSACYHSFTSAWVIIKPLCYEACSVTHFQFAISGKYETSQKPLLVGILKPFLAGHFTGIHWLWRGGEAIIMFHLPSTPLLLPASQHQLVLFVVINTAKKRLDGGSKYPKTSVFQLLI